MTGNGRARLAHAPSLAVPAGVLLGLLLIKVAGFRPGLYVVALSLLLGAGLRLSLPARQAGMLAVRGRTLDGAVLLTLGFGVMVLANSVPGF